MTATLETGVVKISQLLSAHTIDQLTITADFLYATVAKTSWTPDVQRLRVSLGLWNGLEWDVAKRHAKRPEFNEAIGTIQRHVQAYFGKQWQPQLHKSFFRRFASIDMTNVNRLVPWHTDIEAASTADAGVSCFNVWIPLIEVGKVAPGLEFVLGSHRLTRAAPLLTGVTHRDDASVAAMPGERWVPHLVPGDVLVFDEYMLHRTQLVTGDFPTRTSGEMRFAIPGKRQWS